MKNHKALPARVKRLAIENAYHRQSVDADGYNIEMPGSELTSLDHAILWEVGPSRVHGGRYWRDYIDSCNL